MFKVPNIAGANNAYQAIRFVAAALPKQAILNHPALSYIYMEGKGGGMVTLVATTSHVLCRAKLVLDDLPTQLRDQFCENGLMEVVKLDKKECVLEPVSMLNLDYTDYPNWRSAFPKEEPNEILRGLAFDEPSKNSKQYNFSKSLFKLAQAGACLNVDLLNPLSLISNTWDANIYNKSKLCLFETSMFTSLVMGLSADNAWGAAAKAGTEAA